jgi:glycosyltransferase involved in cell wall biosynthesis
VKPLAVAITADPYLPVPPALYGGIERIVDFLARGLAERGHRVTLFAHPASRTAGTLVPYGRPPHRGAAARTAELAQLAGGLWARRRRFDLVHSFGRLAALLPLLPLRSLPKIQTYQREIPWRGVARALALAGPSLSFTACSASMFRHPPAGGATGDWRAVWNGVEVERYRFAAEVDADAPLAFLGRLEPEKGVHHAIAIARRARRALRIAGNRVEEGGAAGYFERAIAPHLDRDGIRWVGPLDDAGKSALLSTSAALLMPVEWEEPFGIVMAEALACGTPVIGFPRGAVPEVVIPGLNGFLADDPEEAAAAVALLPGIDRAAVRRDCTARFGSEAIVSRYEEIYRERVERGGG